MVGTYVQDEEEIHTKKFNNVVCVQTQLPHTTTTERISSIKIWQLLLAEFATQINPIHMNPSSSVPDRHHHSHPPRDRTEAVVVGGEGGTRLAAEARGDPPPPVAPPPPASTESVRGRVS